MIRHAGAIHAGAMMVICFVVGGGWVGGIPNRAAAASPQETIAGAARKVVKIHGAGGVRGLEAYQTGLLVSPAGHVVTVMSIHRAFATHWPTMSRTCARPSLTPWHVALSTTSRGCRGTCGCSKWGMCFLERRIDSPGRRSVWGR